MASNSEANDLLQQGMAAARRGDRAQASSLLQQVLELDERSEQAWLWLSGVVDDPADAITCLENVLTLNPNNAAALKGLSHLQEQGALRPSPVEEPATSLGNGPFGASFGNGPLNPPAPNQASNGSDGSGAVIFDEETVARLNDAPFANTPASPFAQPASPFASAPPASPFANQPPVAPFTLAGDSVAASPFASPPPASPFASAPAAPFGAPPADTARQSPFAQPAVNPSPFGDPFAQPTQERPATRLTSSGKLVPESLGQPPPASEFDSLRNLFGGAGGSQSEGSSPPPAPPIASPAEASFSSFAPTPPSPFGPPAERGSSGVFGGVVNRPFGGANNFEDAREATPPASGLAARAGLSGGGLSFAAADQQPVEVPQPSSPLLIARPPIVNGGVGGGGMISDSGGAVSAPAGPRAVATFPCPNCRQPASENALSCPNCRFQFYTRCPRCGEYVDTTVPHDPRGDRCPNCQLPVDLLELGRGNVEAMPTGKGQTNRPKFGPANEGQTLLASVGPAKVSAGRKVGGFIASLIRFVIYSAISLGLLYTIYDLAADTWPDKVPTKVGDFAIPRAHIGKWAIEQYNNLTGKKPTPTPGPGTPTSTPLPNVEATPQVSSYRQPAINLRDASRGSLTLAGLSSSLRQYSRASDPATMRQAVVVSTQMQQTITRVDLALEAASDGQVEAAGAEWQTQYRAKKGQVAVLLHDDLNLYRAALARGSPLWQFLANYYAWDRAAAVSSGREERLRLAQSPSALRSEWQAQQADLQRLTIAARTAAQASGCPPLADLAGELDSNARLFTLLDEVASSYEVRDYASTERYVGDYHALSARLAADTLVGSLLPAAALATEVRGWYDEAVASPLLERVSSDYREADRLERRAEAQLKAQQPDALLGDLPASSDPAALTRDLPASTAPDIH